MIRDGDKHLCEWRYGFASRFYSALFASMMWAAETELNRLSQGFPEEADAFRRYQTDAGFWARIEGEWKASWPALYAAKPGAPVSLAPEQMPKASLLDRIRQWLVGLE
jgi:hypothetical protein